MSLLLLAAFAWVGWALALAAALVLRRRLALVADAEHELRGAATAIGLAAERLSGPPELTSLVGLELARMGVALADLAEARGARGPRPPDVDAGRLAQVLANVVANAAEHGLGPVEVRARRAGGVVSLEISNRSRPPSSDQARGGRGRGLAIAAGAARALGGRLRVESDGRVTRALVELPVDRDGELHSAPDRGRDDDARRAA